MNALEDIAIIGMAGQFPQSPTLKSFWNHLSQGKELITFFSEEELLDSGIPRSVINAPNYVKAKGLLEDADCFDADFFGYSTREAEVLDPQQRRLLEWAWSALEVAGYDSGQYQGLIGVFVCSSLSSYFHFNLFPYLYGSPQKFHDEMLMVMGNEKDFLATRISYAMNLKGPSKSIQTACSSSLVAVHDACQSLLNHECDMALTGGVSITFPLKSGHFYFKEGITSPDGHCRAFDHLAAGTVTGNGGGVVVLKRLQDALMDGDKVLARIKGSCVNNDGSEKVGYTAPSVNGQAHAIVSAQLSAQVSPEMVSYVECHGTGTILGDPIEIRALTEAFYARSKTKQQHCCAIGSVKTNLGHLDVAAGIVALIKTVLSLKEKQIPPSLHFKQGNPNIPFSSSPFYVNTTLLPWEPKNTPRIAGISSFGIGGTNAHLILSEAPTSSLPQPSEHSSYLLPFSAKNPQALHNLLSSFLASFPSLSYSLADIAYTLQVGRKPFEQRACFVCSSKEEAKSMIKSYLASESFTFHHTESIWQNAKEKWLKGETISWSSFYQDEKRQRVPLPTYPFIKNRYLVLPKPIDRFSHSTKAPAKANRKTFGTLAKNKIEENLIHIWENSLKSEGIGTENNFFSLGGDSLIALEVVDHIRHTFHVELSLQHLFDNPTIALLATVVKEEMIKKIDELSDEEANALLELV